MQKRDSKKWSRLILNFNIMKRFAFVLFLVLFGSFGFTSSAYNEVGAPKIESISEEFGEELIPSCIVTVITITVCDEEGNCETTSMIVDITCYINGVCINCNFE